MVSGRVAQGTAPRQNAEGLLQSQGCKMPVGCIETLSASLSRQLTVDYDYVWFVPSGAVKEDLRQATLVSLPIPPWALANRLASSPAWTRRFLPARRR